MVSAWATQNTLTLGQVKTEAKSNEITAIPQLLDLLDLYGCIVTIDAMDCQREIAQRITDGGADYVLAVKENQAQLHEGIRDLFAGAEALGFDGVPYDYSQTVNKGHGRVERRECWAITETDCLDNYINPHGQWPQMKAAIKVVGHRETAGGSTSQPRYYISSRSASAEQLLAAVRSHWSIENSLHWTLDVTFREDQCRVRKDHGPQNMATLRQISHNLLKNDSRWLFRPPVQPPGGSQAPLPDRNCSRLRGRKGSQWKLRTWLSLHKRPNSPQIPASLNSYAGPCYKHERKN